MKLLDAGRAIVETQSSWEALTDEEHHVHQIRRVHYSGEVAGHRVVVAETAHGRTFYIDGRLQSSQADEWIYHEALVQPAMMLHRNPERVLCVGGSTGGLLREVLRTRRVRRVDFVNAAAEFVAITRSHLPHLDGGVFDDARVRIVERDVSEWLKQEPVPWDVVVIDPPDFPERFGGRDRFLDATLTKHLRDALGSDGMLVVAAGAAHPLALDELIQIHGLLDQVFVHTAAYTAHVPCLGTTWGFVLASQRVAPQNATGAEIDSRISERVGCPLRFLDGTTYTAMFNVPRWLRHRLAAAGHGS